MKFLSDRTEFIALTLAIAALVLVTALVVAQAPQRGQGPAPEPVPTATATSQATSLLERLDKLETRTTALERKAGITPPAPTPQPQRGR